MSDFEHLSRSPFYEWLDHGSIRDLVRGALGLAPGERLVLIKGLVPGLVEALGLETVEEFLAEVAVKVRRYEEARTHPGEGRRDRHTPGELVGGPMPDGHAHTCTPRDPDRSGGRDAERAVEQTLWRAVMGEPPGPAREDEQIP